jgi:hypothetical protein
MIAGALCLLTATSARAGVLVQPGVPFTAAQLEAAIAVRGGPGEDRLDLEVSSSRPGWLVLVTPGGRWEIEVGPAGDEAAARVVALYVIELGVNVIVPEVAAGAATPRMAGGSAPAASGARNHYRLALLGLGSRGMDAGDFAWTGGAIELTRVGPWIAGGGISWQYGLTIDRAPGKPIRAELIRARLVGGAALGPLELVAGGFAGRLFLDGGTEMLGRWSTGLVAEARTTLPVSAGWAVEIAADAELFRERIEVRSGTDAIGATPRTALGARIGFAWTEGRSR